MRKSIYNISDLCICSIYSHCMREMSHRGSIMFILLIFMIHLCSILHKGVPWSIESHKMNFYLYFYLYSCVLLVIFDLHGLCIYSKKYPQEIQTQKHTGEFMMWPSLPLSHRSDIWKNESWHGQAVCLDMESLLCGSETAVQAQTNKE